MINLRIIALSVLILFVGQVYAQDISAKRKKEFNVENDLAIQGYDPVAYFTTGKALEGKKELSFSYQGLTYYFSSAANKELVGRAFTTTFDMVSSLSNSKENG